MDGLLGGAIGTMHRSPEATHSLDLFFDPQPFWGTALGDSSSLSQSDRRLFSPIDSPEHSHVKLVFARMAEAAIIKD